MRRAKIIATLGPASDSLEKIGALWKAGANAFRLNFSHGNFATHRRAMRLIRSLSNTEGRPIAVVQDLQGVKIRTGPLEGGVPVQLEAGREFSISVRPKAGNHREVSTSYQRLTSDVKAGERVLLSDGLIELVVRSVSSGCLKCEIVTGGELRENQGINLPSTKISAPSLTPKDLEDLAFGVREGVDFVAFSFVRSPEDLVQIKAELARLGADIPVIAKVEKPEAVEHLEGIVDAADGIMVARGDLGVEVPPEKVPPIQKRAVRLALAKNKVSIIATQMLDSMINRQLPTRAEASDVANAVFDGADALMLSGETAIGKYPSESVAMMARIISEAEKDLTFLQGCSPIGVGDFKFPVAVCEAASRAAKMVGAKIIVAFTQSGSTAKIVSSYRPQQVIYGCTIDPRISDRMALYWGVYPMVMKEILSVDEMVFEIERIFKELEIVRSGDNVVIIGGAPIAEKGGTNLLKLHTVK